jgi:hypothetical protein
MRDYRVRRPEVTARRWHVPREGTKARAAYDKRLTRKRAEQAQKRAKEARILAAYDMADSATRAEGRAWYGLYRDVCHNLAERYDIESTLVIAAGALLSPQTTVDINLRNLETLCEAYARGDEYPPNVHIPDHLDRAWDALGGDLSSLTIAYTRAGLPKGNLKTRYFYRNILGDESLVCVDRWAARVAGVHVEHQPKNKAYRDIANAYSGVAARVGESPRDLQAITWIVTRGGAW